jgi:hypothetical protein
MATVAHRRRRFVGTSGSRAVLLGIASILCAAAGLAIGILLFGNFGGTEGRILTTTFVLAAHGVLALPAAILWDRRRFLPLAAACALFAAAGATLDIGLVWAESDGDWAGQAAATSLVWCLAASQTAALALAPHRRLYAASVATALLAAVLISAAIWAEPEREGFARVVAALVVLDLLLVALQPLLARARRVQQPWTFRVRGAGPETSEITVHAASLAEAAAKAIRIVEQSGGAVWVLEPRDRTARHDVR